MKPSIIHLIVGAIAVALAAADANAQTTPPTTEPADSLSQELQEVVVKANQPATRIEGTSLLSTIVGTPLETLGTALDVLAQLPMISVTDGAVSVAGRGAPEIFIDGRPLRDGEELQRLRSDNIRRVELELAPGAMYAATTRAVLKITTRRNFFDGLSLTDRATVERRRSWTANEMIDLNYRTGAWDIFGGGLIARNNSIIMGSTVNTLIYDGRETTIGSTQRNSHPSTNGSVTAGVNYASGERSAGAYYRFHPERGDFLNQGTEWIDTAPQVPLDISQTIRARSHQVSLYYDDTFRGGVHLHFDGDFKTSHNATATSTTYPTAQYDDVHSTDARDSRLWAGKLYAELPLWSGRLSAGTQDSYTRSALDYRMLNPAIAEYIPSALTEARQTSTALFATWNRRFGRLSVKAGARYEYVDYQLTTNGTVDKDVSRRDHYLTPDLTLGYAPDDRSEVSLSYRMSTVKPPYSQLTGSLSYVGSHQIEGGNPLLRDERMHDLTLMGMWGDLIMQADYTRSLDTYAFVKRVYPAPTLQLLSQPVNIDVSALSLYLVWGKSIGCWRPNITAGMYKQWLQLGDDRYGRPIFSYYFDNVITLPHDWQLTVNAMGQSAGDMHTNRFGTTVITVDAAVSKSLLDNNLQLRLSATDIFNSANNDWRMHTYGVNVVKRQTYDRRGVALTVSYRFHPRKSNYKGDSASQSELNRL